VFARDVPRLTRLAAAAVSAAALAVACGSAAGTSPRFVAEHAWTGGAWLPVDTHVHTRFSDGSHTVAEIVDKAREYGCRALAITDHADRSLKAATPEYRTDIEAVRRANADMIVLAGLEWNLPPYGGDEHATLLVPPGADEWDTLSLFKGSFDDYELQGRPTPDVGEALRWLGDRSGRDGLGPLVIYNHPSRRDLNSMDNVADIVGWRMVNDLVVGFEGAPGHQGRRRIGSYEEHQPTIDRWDPAAARVGDAWDALLQRGTNVHAALAGSDFHNASRGDLNDRWPCQFAETWLRVPEPTAAGVLQALRAGSGFAIHGRIAREVELTVEVEGLPRPAGAGEIIQVPEGTLVRAVLSMQIPATDWEGQPNRIDTVEMILIRQDGVSTESLPVAGAGAQWVSLPIVVRDGVVVRARGRRVIDDGPDLMFYTNAIRVNAAR
jgi:hypothetical protein